MESLKSLLSDDLKLMIAEGTTDVLDLTCSSLLEFCQHLPQFQSVIGELTGGLALCRKSKEFALDWKGKGNECFSEGDYAKALSFYSKALQCAPMGMDDMDDKLVGTLFVNRACALHKIGLFEECIRDCGRAITIYPIYAKEREGKCFTPTIMEDIQSLFRHHSNCTSKSDYLKRNEKLHDVSADIKLHCITTPDKGRGMVSSNDIPPASLIHTEEPFAAIISKTCRESSHGHCGCNEGPADSLFCSSCTIPLYCSEHCLEQAVGFKFVRSKHFSTLQNNLSEELWNHVRESISMSPSASENVAHLPEHLHECGGSHWSAVLPTDVVLAGRIMMKSVERRKVGGGLSNNNFTLDFSHHYNKIPPDYKLEMHLYALVLAYCLRQYLPSVETFISKFVLLISQIKVNAMAVVHMKSFDEPDLFKKPTNHSVIGNAFTCTVEQVRVGQAIYSMGSLFNHSCKPNVHAYFLSRTLHLRCTDHVPAHYPLELSYGPQIGELGHQERQHMLEAQYFFKCCCIVCSELNFPDLVINSFRCTKPNCLGAVVGMAYEKLEDDSLLVSTASYRCKLSLSLFQECKINIHDVAYFLLEGDTLQKTGPGNCLTCCSALDLPSSISASNSSLTDIERLKDMIVSFLPKDNLISDILTSLGDLRSVRHAYSKVVAQAEDNVAETFAMIGQFEHAKKHCQASIEILEKLYHTKHITVAHERMKLASIHLSLGNKADALCNIMRVEGIFSLYYGSHVPKIFPYFEDFKNEVEKIGLVAVR
ncbi:LOW QUALITY PROTEIN: SET and MYND domain-containing protein 4 [Phalaenopsis equestris]|uniref:LOW QUALITY PROTEIN: SET and MYND domain-containing protein 4 n=1 Tax=Phalaenopsis equestris TaxID=78828 RepID=UPI0009E331EA|nr:LOW QUALITY PROTEIN: SET and MYND domain-containing protein 4 [Phalaenopsis equestris]